MTERIRIGLSVNFIHADPERALYRSKVLQYVESRLSTSLWRAGAMPTLLPDLNDDAALELGIDDVDGLLLTGGADVSPRTYGEAPIDARWPGDAVRDAYEIKLVRLALARGLPILGICRGAQLLNVALGGTLWQDIPTQVEGALVHREWERYDDVGHVVELARGSWISLVYGGATELVVNSVHHQGLRRVPQELRATAWAPDRIVEAIESTDRERWIVGVQWHPEWLEPPWNDGSLVFAAFVRVCRERRS